MNIIVEDASLVEKAAGKCSLIFSAVEMEKQAILAVEIRIRKKQGFRRGLNTAPPQYRGCAGNDSGDKPPTTWILSPCREKLTAGTGDS